MEFAGILRALLAAALGGLVTKGFLTGDQMEQLIQLVLGVGGIIGVAAWSYASNRLKTMVEHVVKSDEVKVVVTEPELANSIESPKVLPVDPARSIQ